MEAHVEGMCREGMITQIGGPEFVDEISFGPRNLAP